jgi:hypothetical protein
LSSCTPLTLSLKMVATCQSCFTTGQSVLLGCKTHNQFFFKLSTCFHSPYVTSSLTREWVYSLQLLLDLASTVILRSDSRGTRDHNLLSQIRDSTNLEGQMPVFKSPQEQGGVVMPSGTGFPFRRLRLVGLRWRYSTPPPHGCELTYRVTGNLCF